MCVLKLIMIIMKGELKGELNTYISDYHTRTDNRPQARYLNWEASYLDASSTKNGLSSRHLTPHPFLPLSHGYHLLGLMHNWRRHTCTTNWRGYNWRGGLWTSMLFRISWCARSTKIQYLLIHSHYLLFSSLHSFDYRPYTPTIYLGIRPV